MKRLDMTRNQQGGHVPIGDHARVRSSTDGRVFGVTADQDRGDIVVLTNGAAFTSRSMLDGRFTPGADGVNIFGLGLFNHQGQNTAKRATIWCVPALQRNFYLAVPYGTYHPQNPSQ
jgi:hypothetical protein